MLVEQAGPSGQFKPVARYGYYADNRRSFKVVAGQAFGGGQLILTTGDGQASVTKFFYDGWRTVEEQSLGVQTEATYVSGPMYLDEHVAMDRRNPGGVVRRFFYHQNTIFNVMGLTDEKGKLREVVSYDIYGQPFFAKEANFEAGGSSNKSKLDNPFLFSGQRFDAESGFCYYKYRYLSPLSGRFLSRDFVPYDSAGHVIDLEGGRFWSRGNGAWLGFHLRLNLYAYVDDNPLNLGDPLGLEKIDLDFGTRDLGFREWMWMGFPTSFATLDELIREVDNRIKPPIDKTGKCGNCLRTFTIRAHSGAPGVISFSSMRGFGDDRDMGPDTIVESNPNDPAVHGQLAKLKPYFCDDGWLLIRQCSAGRGAEGTKAMLAVAKTLEVPVVAATSHFRAGFNPTGWKTVYPNGTVETTGKEVEDITKKKLKKLKISTPPSPK